MSKFSPALADTKNTTQRPPSPRIFGHENSWRGAGGEAKTKQAFANATQFLAFALLLTTLLTSCGGKKDPEATSDPKAASTLKPAPKPDEVVGIGRVEPEGELVPLSSIESGVVTKVYVKQGDVVKAGDLLLELDHDVLSAQIEQSHRRVLSQASRIKTDEISLKEAQTRAVRQSQNVTRTENLVKTGAETGQTLFD